MLQRRDVMNSPCTLKRPLAANNQQINSQGYWQGLNLLEPGQVLVGFGPQGVLMDEDQYHCQQFCLSLSRAWCINLRICNALAICSDSEWNKLPTCRSSFSCFCLLATLKNSKIVFGAMLLADSPQLPPRPHLLNQFQRATIVCSLWPGADRR